MARFLVFAAWTPEDAALWNSRWMAEQTIRLAAGAEAVAVQGGAAVRRTLELALEDGALDGLALFGHGLPHAVMGSDGGEALERCQRGVRRPPLGTRHGMQHRRLTRALLRRATGPLRRI
ncbi:hypothetical protein WMF31_28040 [Sorangium sp. So ce1036]|uniref:hypothetical protein n=1 Tax=Sorangium sp. So ce1036 TaxID=3133328 RepID=UPI003F0DF8ED